MLTMAIADRWAFEALLSREPVAVENLQRNDNRSQNSVQRNLDYVIHHAGFRTIVELEGRNASQGRVRPSCAWLKQTELQALLDWEHKHRDGRAFIVFAFRSEVPFEDQVSTIRVEDLHYVFLAIRAKDYNAVKKSRSRKWDTIKIDKIDFWRLVKPAKESLLAYD